LGHNILYCKKGWILSALNKKRCLKIKKTSPKKVSIIIKTTISTTKNASLFFLKRKRKYQPKKKFLNMIEVIRPF